MATAPHIPRELAEYLRLGQDLLEGGSPLVAYDTLAEGVAAFPNDVRLRQLLALALVRTGAARSAIQLLSALRSEGHTDEETLGLLARVHKNLWEDSSDPAEKRVHLHQAFEHYLAAYRITNGIWTGINAATAALMLGNHAEARALANDVRVRCVHDLAPGADHYWTLATLGEAALILEEWPQAEENYAQAAEIGRRRIGDLASTRRNTRLILRHLGVERPAIELSLRIPRVVAFAGHLVDRADRAVPRFPVTAEAAVRRAIKARLVELDAGFGYASAASGADILFLETLRELNGELHVVLPYNSEQFVSDSVDVNPAGDWKARFHAVIENAAEVVTASDQSTADGTSYDYAFRLLDGMAGLRADELDTDLISMAVWDKKPGHGAGGTASTVSHWHTTGRPVEIIDLEEILHNALPATVSAATASVAARQSQAMEPHDATQPHPGFTPEIVSLLFADARGFSKLTDNRIPAFVERFLGAVAAEIAAVPVPPAVRNTWGDGLHFVFRTVRDAGLCALRLSDAIGAIDWTSFGLPADLSLRIGLHAGPAYACLDPVTGRPNYFGLHVSRAARIEPITPPGEVYASRPFAALARSDGIVDFRCEYVGQTPLAKGYGTYPMYVVRRRDGDQRLAAPLAS